MVRLFCIVVPLLLFAGSVRAQHGGVLHPYEAFRENGLFNSAPQPSSTQHVVTPKKHIRALLLAIGHTIGPIGLGLLARQSGNSTIRTMGTVTTVYGAFVGPSGGNFYANDLKRGMIGIGIRTVGVGCLVAALSLALDGLYEEGDADDTTSAILTVTGLSAFAGSAIWNIYTAPISADEYNREHEVEVSLGPNYWPKQDAAGLQVRVTF